MRIVFIYLIFFLTNNSYGNSFTLKADCLEILRKAAVCKDFWVQVHAIEYSTELGYTKGAEDLIKSELAEYKNVPQKRIGFWRSSFNVSQSSEEKLEWLKKIKNAYLKAYSLNSIVNSKNHILDDTIYQRLKILNDEKNKESRIELCRSLAKNGGEPDIPFITWLVE